MKGDRKPEVCSGTYYPRCGPPRRGYYVLVGEVVVAGPFKAKRNALAHVARLCAARRDKGTELRSSIPSPSPSVSESLSTSKGTDMSFGPGGQQEAASAQDLGRS